MYMVLAVGLDVLFIRTNHVTYVIGMLTMSTGAVYKCTYYYYYYYYYYVMQLYFGKFFSTFERLLFGMHICNIFNSY